MFKKWFAKYARAVSDERERERLYKKYRAKTIVSILFYALCISVIVLALVIESQPATDPVRTLFAMAALSLCWIGFAIANLCLWISFKRTFRAILNRPAYSGEMPEVTSYRQ